MKSAFAALAVVLAACANGPSADGAKMVTWNEVPLTTRWTAGGDLEITLAAPTASHALEILEIGGGANTVVRLRHTTPGDAFVAQVITPLQFVVPVRRLTDTRTVEIWIQTCARGTDPGDLPAARLARIVGR